MDGSDRANFLLEAGGNAVANAPHKNINNTHCPGACGNGVGSTISAKVAVSIVLGRNLLILACSRSVLFLTNKSGKTLALRADGQPERGASFN